MNPSTNSHAPRPPTEVTAKATRRRFNAEYKRKFLAEADASAALCFVAKVSTRPTSSRGELPCDAGELAGLTPKKRGPKVQVTDPLLA